MFCLKLFLVWQIRSECRCAYELRSSRLFTLKRGCCRFYSRSCSSFSFRIQGLIIHSLLFSSLSMWTRLTPTTLFSTKGCDFSRLIIGAFMCRCTIIWSRLLLAIKPESISMSSSTSVKSRALQRLRSLISSTLGLLLSLIFIR